MAQRKHLHRFTIRQVVKALDITDRTIANWRRGTDTREPLPVLHTRPRGLSGRSPVFIYEWRLRDYLRAYRPDLLERWEAARPKPHTRWESVIDG